MERYYLFLGAEYYPSGGWEDLQGSFPTIPLAIAQALSLQEDEYTWWHIVDSTTGRIVCQRDYCASSGGYAGTWTTKPPPPRQACRPGADRR